MDAADTSRELNTFMEFTENSDATFGESWRSAVPRSCGCHRPAYPKSEQGEVP